MKKEIPICLITDEKYPFAVMTTLISALENIGNNSFYKIYCLLTSGVKNEDRENLLSLQKIYQDKCSVELIDMGEKYLSDNLSHKRISNACRYKFLLGDILPQYEKVLYLDFDVVVRGDLSELYETDISQHVLAGVFGYNHYLFSKVFLEILDIPDMKSYINAGIMLINLDRLREKELQDKIKYYMGTFDNSVDQHIFNKICYGKIKLVEPKYNMFYVNYKYYKKGIGEVNYTKEQILEAANNPVMFHYAGGLKPWEYYDLPFSNEWYRYYKLSPYGKNRLKRKSVKIYNLKKWLEKKIKKIRDNKNLLVKNDIKFKLNQSIDMEKMSKIIKNIPHTFSILLTGDFLSCDNFCELLDELKLNKFAINIETKIGNVSLKNLEKLKDYEIKNIEIEVLDTDDTLTDDYMEKIKYLEKNIEGVKFYSKSCHNVDLKRYLGFKLQQKKNKYTNDKSCDKAFCKQIYLKHLLCLPDGQLYPCEYCINDEYKMGDLSEFKLKDIYKNYGHKIPNLSECRNCACAYDAKFLSIKNMIVKISNSIFYNMN